MSNLQPVKNQEQTFSQRARQFWLRMIEPHPSVTEIGEFHRAQLLSTLTLILSVFLFCALFSRPNSIGVFLVLGGITLTSYALSRTKYYRFGAYIFTYAFTAVGFIRIYQGTANSIEFVHLFNCDHFTYLFQCTTFTKRFLNPCHPFNHSHFYSTFVFQFTNYRS